MRLYTMVNSYLSSVQYGIQTAHCISDMFVKYQDHLGSPQTNTLFDWAQNHKTIIMLNGGNCAELAQLYVNIRDLCLDVMLPRGYFKEDEQSLNNAITCVGIVIPPKIYEFAAELRKTPASLYDAQSLSLSELDLAVLINQFPLAR